MIVADTLQHGLDSQAAVPGNEPARYINRTFCLHCCSRVSQACAPRLWFVRCVLFTVCTVHWCTSVAYPDDCPDLCSHSGTWCFATDIQNAYLQAPPTEKHFIIYSLESGVENNGKVVMVWRALYDGKVTGRDFWYHFRSCMEHQGFQLSKANPAVFFWTMMMADGNEYYEYVLLYTIAVLWSQRTLREYWGKGLDNTSSWRSSWLGLHHNILEGRSHRWPLRIVRSAGHWVPHYVYKLMWTLWRNILQNKARSFGLRNQPLCLMDWCIQGARCIWKLLLSLLAWSVTVDRESW